MTSINPLTAESDLIFAAQAGSESAMATLLDQYAPALRAAVRRYADALDQEDAEQEAALAFVELVQSFDLSRADRLAGVVADHLTRALSGAAMRAAHFTVPERTLQRFYGLLKKADGDVAEAVEIAPAHGMSREVFLAVLAVQRGTESLDGMAIRNDEGFAAEPVAFSLWENGGIAGDDAVLVELAFSAVDDLETDVCRLYYGFAEYDPQPDAEIAHRLGYSRPKVQRVRSSALSKMRNALGA